MAYTPEFSTENAIYRLFHTDHTSVTREDIITPGRIRGLDGIVLETTGDKRIPTNPENALWLYDHSHVIEIVKSLGRDAPPIYVVDVNMDDMLSDALPDHVASIFGGAFAAFGVRDLVILRENNTRRDVLRRGVLGFLKIGAAFTLGTPDRIAREILPYFRGEIGDENPLKWHYFDLIVPDMVIGRDAIYARKLEEGVVPLIQDGSSTKVKLDIHCGAGHTRMPRFIQDKTLRDERLKQYAENDFSEFNPAFLNKIFEFRYDHNRGVWLKREHDVNLF